MDELDEGSEAAAHPALFNAVYCITNSPAERTGLYIGQPADDRALRLHGTDLPGRNFFLFMPTGVGTSVGWAAQPPPQCGGDSGSS
jgi:hypothetical protein